MTINPFSELSDSLQSAGGSFSHTEVKKLCFLFYFRNRVNFSRFNKKQISFSYGNIFPVYQEFCIATNTVEYLNIINMDVIRSTVPGLKNNMAYMFYMRECSSCENFLFQSWLMADWLIGSFIKRKEFHSFSWYQIQ